MLASKRGREYARQIPLERLLIETDAPRTFGQRSSARALGNIFSVNERMLASKRGREYARQIPLERLLIETDAPRTFGQRSSARALGNSLERTLDTLASIRPESRSRIADQAVALGMELLSA